MKIKNILNIIINIILVLVILLFFLSTAFFRVKIPTGSMERTISIGDVLLVKRLSFCKEINRGDICVFKKQEEQMLLIKRVIGLPGEKVEMINGQVYIDGNKLMESYVSSQCDTNKTFYVPEDSYLFLGDNRANSSDARYWINPYVEKRDILGIACYRISPSLSQLEKNN